MLGNRTLEMKTTSGFFHDSGMIQILRDLIDGELRTAMRR